MMLGAHRTRVALVGDSLTVGDGKWRPNECSVASYKCRGSYPHLLEALMGKQQYEVRSFGASGRSIASLMPPGCPPSLRGESSTQPHQNVTCTTALIQTPLIASLVDFHPAIIAVLLGTNDAKRRLFGEHLSDVARTVESQMTLLLRALLRALSENMPLVLVLKPPATMADMVPPSTCARPAALPAPSGVQMRPADSTCVVNATSCTAMHTCFYNPHGCTNLHICLTCGSAPPGIPKHFGRGNSTSTDLLSTDNCVNADALEMSRAGVAWAANAAAKIWSSAPAGDHPCSAGLHLLPAIPLTPDWRTFMDPIHPRPLGSAAIACHVHDSIMQRCDSTMSARADSAMNERYHRFCDVVSRVAVAPTRGGLEHLMRIEKAMWNASQGEAACWHPSCI